MAGKNQAAPPAEAKKRDEPINPNWAYDGDFEKQQGEEYGGKSEILTMQIGDVAGPIEYLGSQAMTTELGEVDTSTGRIGEDSVRLPIGATFTRAVDQADLQRGDKFIVKRFDDTIKKSGKGKGQTMPVYAIKVISRAPRQPVNGN